MTENKGEKRHTAISGATEVLTLTAAASTTDWPGGSIGTPHGGLAAEKKIHYRVTHKNYPIEQNRPPDRV